MLQARTAAGVRTLALARPERGNALSAELVEALLAALDDACADAAIHTLVLRADGKHFCTGFDLADLAAQSDGDLLQRFVRIETLLAALWHAPMRTVALAGGRTWGAGADLFASCDVRAASTDATFRFPGAGFGLVLGTRRLAERIGVDRARRCVSEGLALDAATAQADGLVSDLIVGDADAWLAERTSAPGIARDTVALLHRATRTDRRDADLAALVRSAARPGLKQRIVTYRERQTHPARRPE